MEILRKLVLFVLVLVAIFVGSKALVLCNIGEDGLTACKPSVSKPNPVSPSDECCKALSAGNMTCLCSYKNSMLLPYLGIDPGLAMQLPAKCNLTPATKC
ncbi:hypothetical protein HHK36_013162 [Tetracentron sinense]|uniref:Bifunctional inhibitor/plant lipid transfer protein/seed storage helical domain-containing protein n=1 Tax=Tetracentron sinense TaxID=13715 RepID=A0A834ZA93_TETSI|nr:hypothetical protein HHK36_013158 [Tetracentron sinense]KAF8402210.1 hypothetical protein HHK36_013162 [Tetracentron sinense]